MLTESDKKIWDMYCSRSFEQRPIICSPKRYGIKPYRYSKILDLHGKTVHDSYTMVIEFINEALYMNIDNVTIITGRSGQIKREFNHWMERFGNRIKSIKLVNEGSYLIKIKKKPVV